MTYTEALAEARKVGSSRCTGLAYLAETVAALAACNAVNAEAVYNGARLRGWTDGDDLRRAYNKHRMVLSDLQFEGMGI
jgi:hypothetical protein